MAENKKSVIIYVDWGSTFDGLDDIEAGKLIKHFFDYVRDKNPVAPDKLTAVAFEPIKNQLKRDLQKWDEVRAKRSDAGKASAESKKQQKQQKPTSVESVEQNSTKSTVNVTVIDTVTVTDKEIQNNTLKGAKHFEHIKEFYSHDYDKQFAGFKSTFTLSEYTNFQKFLTGLFRDFTIEQLSSQWDKCLGIGDWKKILQGKGFMVLKPAIEKAISSKEGNREQMALRIKTFTNGLLDEKVFQK